MSAAWPWQFYRSPRALAYWSRTGRYLVPKGKRARRIPRHFVVKGLPLFRGGARSWGVARAQPQRPLALEREIHRHHAPLAVLAHQFAPRFPRKSCDRAKDNYYPQPAAVAGVYCLIVLNDKKTTSQDGGK